MCSLFDLYRRRGWEFFHEGQFKEAIAEWRVAADLDPEDGYILSSIGQALSEMGQQEAAVAEWRQAVRLEPNYDKPHIRLAYALSARGYSLEALAAVQAAIRLKSDDVNLYNFLSYHLMVQAEATNNKADWEKAVKPLQQSIALNPTDSYARRHLAKIQWFSGRKREAIAILKAAVAVVPDSIEAYLQLQEYQAAARQFRDMIQTIDAMNKLPDPEEKIAHYYFDLRSSLWVKFRVALIISVGLVAVLVGVLAWNRRQS